MNRGVCLRVERLFVFLFFSLVLSFLLQPELRRRSSTAGEEDTKMGRRLSLSFDSSLSQSPSISVAEFHSDPSKSAEENARDKQMFEGEKKLLQAKAQLHEAKEKEKRELEASQKEQVSGYLKRFAKKRANQKNRNPKTAATETTVDLSASAKLKPVDSGKKAPPKMKDLIASQYLESYGALTPTTARKKRILMSDAEESVNKASQVIFVSLSLVCGVVLLVLKVFFC